MEVYSPSQTERWSTCPVLWKTEYKDGWRPRVLGRRELAAVQGAGFAAGMAMYNTGRKVCPTGVFGGDAAFFGAVREHARTTVEAELQVLSRTGFDTSILAEYGDVAAMVGEAVGRAVAGETVPAEWRVVAVEEARPEHGYARADVVYERPDGGRVVREYKFTQSIDKKYVPQRLRDYGESAQRHHYLWMEHADTFLVTLVCATPFHIYEQVFARDPEREAVWLASQQGKWGLMEEMEAGARPLFESDTHVTKYGRGDSALCPLYRWCLEHHRDPAALEPLGFIQVTR